MENRRWGPKSAWEPSCDVECVVGWGWREHDVESVQTGDGELRDGAWQAADCGTIRSPICQGSTFDCGEWGRMFAKQP